MKKSFARYLSSHVFKTEVSEKDVLIISGSGAVMDVMGTALLNPAMDGNKSDAFICICYAFCFLSRHHSVLQLVREQLHAPDGRRDVPRRHHEEQVPSFSFPSCSYVVTDAILEEAYQQAVADGRKVKLLVFTNPNNPTGTVYSLDEMRTVLAFCRRHSLHLVRDRDTS